MKYLERNEFDHERIPVPADLELFQRGMISLAAGLWICSGAGARSESGPQPCGTKPQSCEAQQ